MSNKRPYATDDNEDIPIKKIKQNNIINDLNNLIKIQDDYINLLINCALLPNIIMISLSIYFLYNLC